MTKENPPNKLAPKSSCDFENSDKTKGEQRNLKKGKGRGRVEVCMCHNYEAFVCGSLAVQKTENHGFYV